MIKPLHGARLGALSLFATFILSGAGVPGLQQDPARETPAAKPAQPEPDAADVATPAAVVDALYASISGPAGQARDFDRLRSLFHPEGRMVPMVRRGEQGMQPMTMTVGDYIERAGSMLEERGFFEQEVARRSEVFGDIAHVFSTYEARQSLDDAKPWFRGINSIQLCKIGDSGWRVLSIFWEQEHDAGPIPDRYLPQKKDR